MSPSLIHSAAEVLRQNAPQGSHVILFGSHARGDMDDGSDVDFCVVEPEVSDARSEISRLRRTLYSFPIFTDILVVSRADYEGWQKIPGSVYYEIAREGKEMAA